MPRLGNPAVRHLRRREDVPLDGFLAVSAAQTLSPGSGEPQRPRPLGLREWTLLSCRQGSCREVQEPARSEFCCGNAPPLLTQWKAACPVAGFLFCGCPWWGAGVASSSEELRELGGTCPDLPLGALCSLLEKRAILWRLSPVSRGLQLGPGLKSLWAVQFPGAGTGGDR